VPGFCTRNLLFCKYKDLQRLVIFQFIFSFWKKNHDDYSENRCIATSYFKMFWSIWFFEDVNQICKSVYQKAALEAVCSEIKSFFQKSILFKKFFKCDTAYNYFLCLVKPLMFWNLFWFMPFWFILNAKKVLAVEIVPSIEMASRRHVQSHQMIDVSEKTKITKNLTIVVVAMQRL